MDFKDMKIYISPKCSKEEQKLRDDAKALGASLTTALSEPQQHVPNLVLRQLNLPY